MAQIGHGRRRRHVSQTAGWAKSMPAAAANDRLDQQNYGMEVIDSGLAILCMHAPMECPAKRISMKPCEVIKHF